MDKLKFEQGSDNLTIFPDIVAHEIDWSKVKTLEDVKCFLQAMQFIVHDDGSDKWNDIRRFYAEDKQ